MVRERWGGGIGEGGESNLRHMMLKVNVRQSHGEEKWVLGETSRSLEVGAEIEVFVISLDTAVEDVCI